jgi:oxygen-independent coproporphyrinogen-3 oxidase
LVVGDAEITVETNPGTVSVDKLAAYRELGVNRLSVGVQSFRDEDLRFLGRIHDAEEAGRCLRGARTAGFENLSLDLIYALPGQTVAGWLEVLARAMEFEPGHLSAYSLIVEDHTPLARMVQAKLVAPAPAELEADLYESTMRFMAERGFEHYEVSNYALPGFRSRHNFNYWTHGNYLGFGPSAHSFWKAGDAGRRWANVRQISTYCEKLTAGALPTAFTETVESRGLLNERIFLGLRSDGLDLRLLQSEFGIDFTARNRAVIQQLVAERLALLDQDRLRLTDKGYLLCDEVSERLMM